MRGLGRTSGGSTPGRDNDVYTCTEGVLWDPGIDCMNQVNNLVSTYMYSYPVGEAGKGVLYNFIFTVMIRTIYVFIADLLQCMGVQCMCDGRGAPSRGQLTLGNPTFELSK